MFFDPDSIDNALQKNIYITAGKRSYGQCSDKLKNITTLHLIKTKFKISIIIIKYVKY